MSANDVSQFQPLLNMTFDEIIRKDIKIVVFIADRTETYCVNYLSIRKNGNDWYDISIKLNQLGRDIIFNKGRMSNGTY